MHQYEVLPIIWLANIEINVIADTNDWSDVDIYQNSTCIVILKTLFWS